MFKKIIISYVILGCAFLTHAQETQSKKKVVIINKTNIDGKITETRKEAEGDEADKLIKEMDANDVDNININTEGDKKVISINTSIDKTITKDDKGTKVKIIKIDGDNINEMEWEGYGEMPEEMAKEMKNVKIKKIKDGDNMTITIDAEGDEENGKVIVMEEAGKGKKKNKMMIIEDTDKVFFNDQGIKLRMERGNDNKATLGVNIDDTEDGVLITDIVEGSAAAKADIRRDDVILKINDKYIFTSDGLLKALRPFNPGETIKVRYIRDGKEKSVKAKLSGR
jgi:hypothetical protein